MAFYELVSRGMVFALMMLWLALINAGRGGDRDRYVEYDRNTARYLSYDELNAKWKWKWDLQKRERERESL